MEMLRVSSCMYWNRFSTDSMLFISFGRTLFMMMALGWLGTIWSLHLIVATLMTDKYNS